MSLSLYSAGSRRRMRRKKQMPHLGVLLVLFLWSLVIVDTAAAEDDQDNSNNHCTAADTTATDSTTSLWSLQPNMFYKICPKVSSSSSLSSSSSSSSSLDQPICGDGSPFAFLVTRPPQSKGSGRKRLIVEFMGGGACWDANTCNEQAAYLTFPTDTVNAVVGLSCSEAALGMADNKANLLCAGSSNTANNYKNNGDDNDNAGALDYLSAYTTIVVPYCTQDVYEGDSIMTYSNNNDNDNDNDGGGGGNVVLHHGAHNLLTVLRYIYRNFVSPDHIVLTGCSAGGTALPVAYHLLHKHYQGRSGGRTQISVLADSPVYLTPTYFLENAFAGWNPRPLIQQQVGFNYKKWQYDTQFPTQLWHYILQRGSNRDHWGYFQHENDPVSQAYYQWMSNGGDGEERSRRDLVGEGDARSLEDENDLSAEWWSELSGSLAWIQSKHPNVDTFFIAEEEGHCSLGLYYGLQQEGFEEWAAEILRERKPLNGATGHFVWSVLLGILLVSGTVLASRQRHHSKDSSAGEHFLRWHDDDNDDDDSYSKQTPTIAARARILATRVWRQWLVPFLRQFELFPLTAGYAMTLTLYLGIMLIHEGFAHPLNNPSLGPAAAALSAYGINNPSLIVYHSQLYRLVSSAFLSSGLLTYLLCLVCLWHFVRPLEARMSNLAQSGLLVALIALGSNLVYAIVGNGASCSGLALVLGLNAFAIRTSKTGGQCGPMSTTLFVALLSCLVFPFNSWIMIGSALLLGGMVAPLILVDNETRIQPEEEDNDDAADDKSAVAALEVKRGRLYLILTLYGVLMLVVLMRLPHPDPLYAESPFYTGCDLKHSDDLGNLASGDFGGDDGDGRRWLEQEEGGGSEDDGGGSEDDGGSLCGQFCLPHLVSRVAAFGVRRVFGLELQDGTCTSHDYDQHYVDKTFRYATYSLDVEVYQSSGYANDDE